MAAQGRSTSDPLAYSTAVEALDAENYLHSHPDDSSVLKRLLDYYEARWQTAGAERLRLILWTIQNHPDVAFDPPHDGRGFLVNPDTKQARRRGNCGSNRYSSIPIALGFSKTRRSVSGLRFVNQRPTG